MSLLKSELLSSKDFKCWQLFTSLLVLDKKAMDFNYCKGTDFFASENFKKKLQEFLYIHGEIQLQFIYHH